MDLGLRNVKAGQQECRRKLLDCEPDTMSPAERPRATPRPPATFEGCLQRGTLRLGVRGAPRVGSEGGEIRKDHARQAPQEVGNKGIPGT